MNLTVPVKTKSRSYLIHISQHDFANARRVIKKFLREKRLFIITNTTVARLYRKKIEEKFQAHFKTIWLVMPDGERHKNLKTCEKLLTDLSRAGANRNSSVLALGGGVVGDVAGFVASVYMRGISYIQMPTTLLAQVDSSVGGKTGVDLGTGKNLAGTFYQPRAVIIHADFLKTLPEREFRCGMAEVIKYGVIGNWRFFRWLDRNAQAVKQHQPSILSHLIQVCCAMKARIVSQDEKESGQRAILNLGHTLGHAIEVLTHYKNYNHGEAVAIGMMYAAQLSCRLGISKNDESQKLKDMIKKFNLPWQVPPFSPKQYLAAMSRDKKSQGTSLRFILVEKIGKVKIKSLSLKEIGQCL